MNSGLLGVFNRVEATLLCEWMYNSKYPKAHMAGKGVADFYGGQIVDSQLKIYVSQSPNNNAQNAQAVLCMDPEMECPGIYFQFDQTGEDTHFSCIRRFGSLDKYTGIRLLVAAADKLGYVTSLSEENYRDITKA